MKTTRWVAAIAAVFFGLGVEPVHAKRGAPRDVQLERGSRVYRANHWTVANYGTKANGGVVETFDRKSNKLLTWTQVYCIQVDSSLEGDSQDVFIVAFGFQGHSLIVTDELGDVFELDVQTKRVSVKTLVSVGGRPSRVRLC